MNANRTIAGIDEAGRGPLAGAVFAAAVILDDSRPVAGLDDSKKLGPRRRAELEKRIKETALSWSVGRADAPEIDRINILQATLLAMQRAVEKLHIQPQLALVDGNRTPVLDCACISVVGGDAIHPVISAASILAKQARDREMVRLSLVYPRYGFEQHKGYPTRMHLHALKVHGATAQHRRSFAPVRRILEND